MQTVFKALCQILVQCLQWGGGAAGIGHFRKMSYFRDALRDSYSPLQTQVGLQTQGSFKSLKLSWAVSSGHSCWMESKQASSLWQEGSSTTSVSPGAIRRLCHHTPPTPRQLTEHTSVSTSKKRSVKKSCIVLNSLSSKTSPWTLWHHWNKGSSEPKLQADSQGQAKAFLWRRQRTRELLLWKQLKT